VVPGRDLAPLVAIAAGVLALLLLVARGLAR
jgi:hypothetical protein